MNKYLNLQLFAEMNTNTTESEFLTPEMKTFYNTALLQNARPELLYERFAEKLKLPANNGKTIEVRRLETFKKAMTPLVEGVTPDGNKASVLSMNATIKQYGDYTAVSDRLQREAIDPLVASITEEHGAQAGLTLNTVDRNIVSTGTSVIYAAGTSRAGLTGSNKLTSALVNRAATFLKKNNVPRINGKYVSFIHPSIAEDLRNDTGWIEAHKYAEPGSIFDGSIGELHGVVFFESTEQKVHCGKDLSATARNLTLASAASATNKVTVSQTLVEDALVGRYVLIGTGKYYVSANSTTQLTLKNWLDHSTDASVTADSGSTVYPGEGGAAGVATYETLFFGAKAFAAVDHTSEGLQMIVKGLGSGGTEDPLDQRSTVGWKASHTAMILYDERMVRVESGSSYSDIDEEN